MKASFMNYFNNGKVYQWDKYHNVTIISSTILDPSLEFCLDQKSTNTFLNFYEKDNLTLEVGATLKVKCGKLKASLKVYDEKPTLPNMDCVSTFKVNLSILKKANRFTGDAIKTKKPILEGVHVGSGVIEATDSFIVYRKPIESNTDVVIPKELISMLPNSDQEIEFLANDHMISCNVEGTIFIGRYLSGSYPNLENLYQTMNFSFKTSIEEIKSLTSLASDQEALIEFSKNSIRITGENEIESEVEGIDIQSKMALKVQNLLKILAALDGDEFNVYSNGKGLIRVNEEVLAVLVRMEA